MWSVALLLMLVAAGSSASPYGSFSHNVGVSSGVDTNGQEPVRDTPEVTLARQQHLEAVERQKALVGSAGAVPAVHAQHLAVVQDAHARAGVGSSVTPSWAVPFAVSSTPAYWGISSTPVPVQDTVEVAAAKAKHLAAVEEAKARLVAASSESAASSSYHQAYSSSSSSSAGHHQATYSVQSVTPPPVPHTVEVAAAREQQHLSSVAAARLSSAQSIAAQYSAQPRFHYPNVPVDFSPRLAGPLVAPAWPSAAVRFNTIASVEDASGRYVPDDEGQYDSRQDAEGQYDPRYDAEGQYDPRLNAEGHYVPSLNDEGQWIPSANEGQYVPGREDQAGEDNMPYSYSYSDGLSSKTEEKTADGITRGRFSYVDANGVLQAVDYQADNVLGFRASGTNLPQPPSAPGRGPSPIYSLPAPGPSFVATAFRAPVAAYGVPAPSGVAATYAVPVPDLPADTPEVAAAKAAHFAAHREAGARLASAYSG